MHGVIQSTDTNQVLPISLEILNTGHIFPHEKRERDTSIILRGDEVIQKMDIVILNDL